MCSGKRVAVQFHINFPSDANRTMLLDPAAAAAAAAADNADTSDSFVYIRDFLFLAFQHIIFQRFQLLVSLHR
jgi:hypothetical protein